MGHIILDNDFLPIARAAIETAKNKIYISTFKAQLTDKPRGKKLAEFFSILIQKAKDGIKIRLLINWHADRKSVPLTNLAVMRELKLHNIKVKHLPNNRCCHAKVIIIDGRKAILGSHNLSVRSCQSNFELSYLIPDPESIKELTSIFEHSWQGAVDA